MSRMSRFGWSKGDTLVRARATFEPTLKFSDGAFIVKYSDDQPRDEGGRWTDGGDLATISLDRPDFPENEKNIYRGLTLFRQFEEDETPTIEQLSAMVRQATSSGYGKYWTSSVEVGEQNSTGDHNLNYQWSISPNEPIYGVMLRAELTQPYVVSRSEFVLPGEDAVLPPRDENTEKITAYFFRRDPGGARSYVGSAEIKNASVKFVNGSFIVKYDPEQERDESGRWTDGGSAGPSPEERIAESVAVAAYTSYTHDLVNSTLRGSRMAGADQETYERTIASLDSIIARSEPLPEDTTLYRGVAGNIAEEFRSLQPGDTFTDKGYTSTTSADYIAEKFGFESGRFGDVPYVNIVIEAPAGSKAFDVDTYVAERYISGTGRYEGGLTPRQESEFILPRGSTFEVTRNEGDNLYVRLVNE